METNQVGQEEHGMVVGNQSTDDDEILSSCTTTDEHEMLEIVVPNNDFQEEGEWRVRENPIIWSRRIQKVSLILRQDENNKLEYDPMVVSIGPFHNGKPELQLAEDFKHKALEMFVEESGKDADFFYHKILEVIDVARNCYADGSTNAFDNATFAQMMLLDACFIINHIELSTSDKYNKLGPTRDQLGMLVLATTVRDMFLLENQIPYWVLKLLIRLRYNDEEGEELLEKFLNFTLFGEIKEEQVKSSGKKKDQPLHLLEAFRTRLVAQYGNVSRSYSFCNPKPAPLRWKKSLKNGGNNMKKYIHSFRSVSDLKAKGIYFRPSCTNSLKDIMFKSSYFYGLLELPTWYVSIYTKAFFLNMIAYEMCPNTVTDRAVTSYVYFMKSLIESPKDVKELRERQILFNMLGSDEEVANMYKEINTYGVNNALIFHSVKEKIQEHYNSRAKTWIAQLIHKYFSSPWTAIALLAATFLLCLTFTQTFFTINPSFRR